MTRSKWIAGAVLAVAALACTTEGGDDTPSSMMPPNTGSIMGAGAGGPAVPPPAGTGTAGMQAAGAGPSTSGGGVGGMTAPPTSNGGSAAPAGGSGEPVAGDGAAGMDGTAGGGEAGSGPPPVTMDEAMGCGTTKLLPNPDDTSKRGPWPVGEKTVKFGRFNAVDVMYPAMPGSEMGKTEKKFDLRDWLPASERSKVPDAEATQVGMNTFADLPLDETHGPYPVVILVHGTGAFRVASGSTQAHWASRGFVVVAAEHPNLYLTDTMAAGCGQITAPTLDLSGDVDSEIQNLTAASGDLAFLKDHIDMSRIALAGHSAGAFNVAQFGKKPGVQVIIPLSGTHKVDASSSVKSIVFVSGAADVVLPYGPGGFGNGSLLYPGSTIDAYTASPGPPGTRKRVLSITGGGHLAVTDLCQTNAQGKNPLEVAQAHNVCGLGILPTLFDCGTVKREDGVSVVNDITAGVLEETLHCHDRAATISAIKDRHAGLISDFREAK